MNSSYIYDERGINKLDEKYEDKYFFRKTIPNLIELEIAKILKSYQHNNIVEFYNITSEFIDMELLETYETRESIVNLIYKNKPVIKEVMREVKSFLQNLGIVYIDWKIDNVGYLNNSYKLFDFDMSGIFDVNTKGWIIPPEAGFNYKTGIRRQIYDPLKLDNICFENAFH